MPSSAIPVASPRLTKKQAAAYIPCSLRTLDRLPIPRIKMRGIVLYEKSSIDAWMRSQEQPAPTSK